MDGAEFRVGQDVRLYHDMAELFKCDRRAVAGTVTEVRQEKDGIPACTVFFPGKAGIREEVPGYALEALESPAIRLDDGTSVSVKDAWNLLVNEQVRFRTGELDSESPGQHMDALMGLVEVCQWPAGDLARQLQQETGERVRGLGAEQRPGAAAVAAKDSPGPLITSVANVEIDLPGHRPAPPAPRRDGLRP